MDKILFLYADPGAGALLLQMLMAVLFGGLFFFRSIRDRILGIFGKGPYARSKSEEDESSESSANNLANK